MSKTLLQIAEQLRDANKKVQLIYAFNGTRKTRLSREFRQLIAPKGEGEEAQAAEKATVKLLLDHLKSNYGFWQQKGA